MRDCEMKPCLGLDSHRILPQVGHKPTDKYNNPQSGVLTTQSQSSSIHRSSSAVKNGQNKFLSGLSDV